MLRVKAAIFVLALLLAALYLFSTISHGSRWEGWITLLLPTIEKPTVNFIAQTEENAKSKHNFTLKLKFNLNKPNSSSNSNAIQVGANAKKKRIRKQKSEGIQGRTEAKNERDPGIRGNVGRNRGSNPRRAGEFQVSSCEEAAGVEGSGEGRRAAAVLVFNYAVFSTELYCGIFTWRAGFLTVGMNELDFILLIGQTQFSRAQVEELKSYGFVLVYTKLPDVYGKVLYQEAGKQPVQVDGAEYSFLLKLFSLGLTSYEGVFIFDMDAQPSANLYEVKELAWLSPGLKGSQEGAPPTWELYYASEEDTAVLGGYMVARTNSSRCKSMFDTVQRPKPWSPGYGWAKKPVGGKPFVTFPIWEGSACMNRDACSSPRFTTLGANASAACKSGLMLAGCLAEPSDQGLLLQEYVLNNPHEPLYKSPTVKHYLFDGAYERKMYHGYKPWELLQAEPAVQQLLATWGLGNGDKEPCCPCNAALAWWENYRRAVQQHKLPAACVALKRKYDKVLKSHLRSRFDTFISNASHCLSNG